MDKELVPFTPTWRQKNAAKARETRRKKLLDAKTREIEEKVDGLSKEVDKKIDTSIDKEVKKKVNELMSDMRSASTLVKQSFLDAFEKSGGVEGLVDWISKNDYTKKEFYKMIISLLKTETLKPDSGSQKQAVIVNISGVGKDKELKVELNGEPSSN